MSTKKPAKGAAAPPAKPAAPSKPPQAKPLQAKPFQGKPLQAKPTQAKAAPPAPSAKPAAKAGAAVKPAPAAKTGVPPKPGAPVKPAGGAKPTGAANPTATKPTPPVVAANKPAGKPSGKAAKPAAAAAGTPGVPGFSTASQQRAITNMKAFFDRTLSALDESDSSFAPVAGMFTTAQQIAHAAQTYDWFREGAFSSKGFRMDFPAMEAEVRKVTSLTAAKAWLDEAHQRLLKSLQTRPPADWHAPIAKETIMAGAPRIAVIDGLVDHTAHHRGALAVYARLRGKTPPMPYM